MRLFRSIAGAQGGRVFANLGTVFRLNDELAAQIVRYFLPPITKSILRRTESVEGLIQFLELMGRRRFDRYLADPKIFGHPKIGAEGRAVLRTLFPNPAHLGRIIGNRVKVLPVQPELVESMLPYIAIIALGAIELKTRQPLKGMAMELLDEQDDLLAAQNPYHALAGELRRRWDQEEATRTTRRSALTSAVSALFSRGDAARAA